MRVDYSPAHSFRRSARNWLASTDGDPEAASPRAFELGGERVLVLNSGYLSARQTIEALLIVRGHFACGAQCRFLRPVYIAGGCEIGKGSRLASIEADGPLTLYPSVEVTGWAGSLDSLEIRSGCRIGSLAFSRKLIRLGLRAEMKRLRAPRILTPEGIHTACSRDFPTTAGEITILPSPAEGRERVPFQSLGMDPAKLHALGADTWVYEADLHLTAPVLLRAHLVIRGSFDCGESSLLEGDVKTDGTLSVGAGSVAKGNLIAGGDLMLGPSCVFQGELRSRQMMRLASGVRGLREGGPVEGFAAGELVLEEGVGVWGELRSASAVVAVPVGIGAVR